MTDQDRTGEVPSGSTPSTPTPSTPPSAAEPTFSPDAHRLDLGRLGVITLVVGIALTGPLGWACFYAVATDPDPVAKGIAGFFGLFFGALRVTDKRGIALEIVPVREEDLGELPRLLRYRAKEPAPTPGVPPVMWRVRLPGGYHSFEKLIAAGERFGGHTWEGWFRRQWSGGAGRGAREAV